MLSFKLSDFLSDHFRFLSHVHENFLHCKPVESQKQSEKVRNRDTVEQLSLLKIVMEDTSVSPSTMRHEDEGNITGENRKV